MLTEVARFLLLEDYAPLAATLERVLKDLGEVQRAATATEAGQALRASRDWSAFFVDVLLPDGNGLDVLALARDLGYRGPAMVFSAIHEPEAINRAFDLGARYLVKPSELDVILSFARDASEHRPVVRLAQTWAETYDLTAAETAILVDFASGVTRDQLIRDRGIARRTFQKHVQNLLRKTGDKSLMAASMRLLQEHQH
jgi:DNA-binding NarL/FixJ family response regulator